MTHLGKLLVLFLFITTAGYTGAFAQKILPAGYQLQNKATGLLMRPLDANSAEGNPIVIYPKTSWRCLTWELLPAGDSNLFTLKNYFTSKTIRADKAEEGKAILQTRLLVDGSDPKWRFVPVGSGYYKIEHPSGLILSVDDKDTDSPLLLKKWTNDPRQMWKLLPKPEKFTG
jgi:hypothetical protein